MRDLEYYGDDHLEAERTKFKEDFDTNEDGFLSGDELGLWLGPDNTEIAIEEAGELINFVPISHSLNRTPCSKTQVTQELFLFASRLRVNVKHS